MFLNGDLGAQKLKGLLKRGCLIIGQPSFQECVECGPELAVICVIHNAFFDAAAYIDSPYDYECCDEPQDPRPRTWLLAETSMLKDLI